MDRVDAGVSFSLGMAVGTFLAVILTFICKPAPKDVAACFKKCGDVGMEYADNDGDRCRCKEKREGTR